MSTEEPLHQSNSGTTAVKIRLFQEKDASACASIWLTGLNQTVQSSSFLLRPLYRWGMAKLGAEATAPGGDVGPEGSNLYKIWGGKEVKEDVEARSNKNSESNDNVQGIENTVTMGIVDRALFVAESAEGKVLGLCCVKRGQGDKDIPEPDYPIFSIWRMSVDESARGLGVGRAVLTACEEWARSRGGHKMTLVTGNKIAARFYVSCGYATVDYWGIRHDKTLVAALACTDSSC